MHSSRSDADGTDARRQFPSKHAVIMLLVAALIVRAGILTRLSPRLIQDPDKYRHIAEMLVDRGVLGLWNSHPTRPFSRQQIRSIHWRPPLPWHASAYRPPLYPILIAPCVALNAGAELAIGGLHLVLGVATVGLTVWLARLWGLGRQSLLAGALVACDPILLNQSALVMTETAATFLATAALLALTLTGQTPSLWRAAVAGLMMALAALCRPTFLPWAGCAALIMLWQVQAPWKFRALLTSGFCVAVAVGLGPWIIRNQVHFGRPIATTTHGGYTLLLANNASFYRWLREGNSTAWQVTPEVATLNFTTISEREEVARDKLAYDLAFEAIRAAPAIFVWSCAVRLGYLWRPLPQQLDADEGPIAKTSRWVVAVWYAATYLLVVAGLFQIGRSLARTPWIWGLSLIACITLTHTFYWSNMRMRAPAVPVLSLIAATGAARLIRPRQS